MVFPHTYRTENSVTRTTSSEYGEFYELNNVKSEPISPKLLTILNYVDDHKKEFIEDLRELVSIPSVSGSLEHVVHINEINKVVERWMRRLDIKYECFDMGWYKIDGMPCKVPPVILGSLGNDPKKKTICVYSHLDVLNADTANWNTDPWNVTETDDSIMGKGVAFGKGPLICWFHAILAYQRHQLEVPVNIQFIVESMHERASFKLKELLREKKSNLFTNIDYIVVCDCEWLGSKVPCLVYGATGICRFRLKGTKQGESDPVKDVFNVLKRIYIQNEILIPHLHEHIEPVTPAEEKLYDTIDLNLADALKKKNLPADLGWDKVRFLMAYWRKPRICVNSVYQCECTKQTNSIIYQDVTLYLVPKHKPKIITDLLRTYITDICNEMKYNSKIELEMLDVMRPWLVSFNDPNFQAARKACIQVYSEDANMIRHHEELPTVIMLENIFEKNILVLPLASMDSCAGATNENIKKKNFFGGIKLLIAYLQQLSVV